MAKTEEQKKREQDQKALSEQQLQSLFDYVDQFIARDDCEDAARGTLDWLEERGINPENVVDWLEKTGRSDG